MALHTTQTVSEIAISRVRKSQDEITGKRAREGEEGRGRGQKSGVQEFRSAEVQEWI